MKRCKTCAHGLKRLRVGVRKKGRDLRIAKRCVEIGVKKVIGHRPREVLKRGHVFERHRDLGRAPEAMPAHTRDPSGMAGAGMNDTGNFFRKRTCARTVRVGCIEMVETRRTSCDTGDALGGGEPCFMRGIILGQQQIGFGQILCVHESRSVCHTGAYAAAILRGAGPVQSPA